MHSGPRLLPRAALFFIHIHPEDIPLKHELLVITCLLFLSPLIAAQSDDIDRETENAIILGIEDSLFYAKTASSDFLLLSLEPSLSMEWGASANAGISASGKALVHLLGAGGESLAFSAQSLSAFGRLRLFESPTGATFGFVSVGMPVGVEVGGGIRKNDILLNQGRIWHAKMGGRIEHLDDPVLLGIDLFFGLELAPDWDTKESSMVTGGSIFSVFSIGKSIAVKLLLDMRYTLPLEGSYVNTITWNGMENSIGLFLIHRTDRTLNEGGVRRSTAPLGQSSFGGSTRYAIPLGDR